MMVWAAAVLVALALAEGLVCAHPAAAGPPLDQLKRSYISKIELFNGERVSFLGDAIDGVAATVRTKIITRQSTEIPVEYRMLKRGERWLVYDVIIEGVSLIANYRAQFNKIIQTSSYQELVKRMKSKQDEFIEQDKASRT